MDGRQRFQLYCTVQGQDERSRCGRSEPVRTYAVHEILQQPRRIIPFAETHKKADAPSFYKSEHPLFYFHLSASAFQQTDLQVQFEIIYPVFTFQVAVLVFLGRAFFQAAVLVQEVGKGLAERPLVT